MTTPLFFVRENPPGWATITGSDARHIRQALRLRRGDLIRVCDEQGRHYRARIREVGAGKVLAALLEEVEARSDLEAQIVLGQGLTKGDKMDWIVQKSTELGAAVLAPVQTTRSVVRLSPATADRRVARWQRIAQEAAKQSGRREPLRVSEIIALPEFCQAYRHADLKLILWEGERAQGLRDVLREERRWRQVAALIGPEGGFSPAEVEEARAWDFQPTSLGVRILRTETVSLALLSVLLYCLRELG